MANELDRLFRENLDQYEVQPAASSWEQVQSQIAGKRNKWLIPMRIAAAIIVLISATIAVINFSKTGTDLNGQLAIADHPVLERSFSFEWNIPAKAKIQIKESKVPVSTVAQATVAPVKAEPAQIQQFKTIELSTYNDKMVAANLPLDTSLKGVEMLEPKQPSIKITYIASNQPAEKTHKLSQLMSRLSQDVSPTELLSDIRDAKDHLFNIN